MVEAPAQPLSQPAAHSSLLQRSRRSPWLAMRAHQPAHLGAPVGASIVPSASCPPPRPAEHALKAMKATPSAEEVLSQGIDAYDALFIPGGGKTKGARRTGWDTRGGARS